ncbi:sialic acid-binding Ig-like lectin 13 [Microcaecilia unicolor]|uniref:Sialic acid-binding Ig-like lectin 13 n=1 Tax=Microcaecilia unicolor TaxID=1415580 RepID=A0A6P7Z024_9AMPH|nr:sialic acid-binding Ig-like lectin 13 [Microcaecilia unicolor]
MKRAGFLLLSLIRTGFLFQKHLSFDVIVSESITVQKGLCVLIPCNFTFPENAQLGDKPHGFWFREKANIKIDKPVATNHRFWTVSEETSGRFKLVGDIKKHDCTFRIDDAKKEDREKYFLRIHGGFNYSYVQQTQPFVNVIDLWEQPELSPSVELVAGTPVNITCTAPGRCSGTPPRITWTGTLNTANSTLNTTSVNRDGTVTHASMMSFIPSIGDQSKTLTCEVYYPAVGASTKTTLNLNVQFGPRSGDGNSATCNSDPHQTKCSCVIQSNPPPVMWWLINNELFTGNYSNGTLQVSSITYGHTGTSNLTLQDSEGNRSQIVCISLNTYGALTIKLSRSSKGEVVKTSSKLMIQGGFYGAAIISLIILMGFLLVLGVKKIIKGNTSEAGLNGMVDQGKLIHTTAQDKLNSPRVTAEKRTAATTPTSVTFFTRAPVEVNENGDESLHYATIDFLRINPRRKPPLPSQDDTEYSELQHIQGKMVTAERRKF